MELDKMEAEDGAMLTRLQLKSDCGKSAYVVFRSEIGSARAEIAAETVNARKALREFLARETASS